MQTKLTLRLEEDLIAKAKAHARETGKSLSQTVADYFRLLTTKSERQERPLSPVVRSLKGSLRHTELHEDDYRRHLEEKYL